MLAKCVAFVLALCACCAGFASARQDTPITDGAVAVSPAVRIHFLQSGDALSSRALILIPGWRLPAWLWQEQLRKFGAEYRVVAIDPRSQGESTKTQDGNTPERRAEDLHTLLAQLKISRCVLVGWSQGAQDVAAYLGEFGTSPVAGVVLVDSPVSAGPAELDLHRASSRAELSNIALYSNVPEAFSRGMMKAIFARPHPAFDSEALVHASLGTPTSIGIAMLTADIFGADRRSALATLNRPALVVASAESPLLDEQRTMVASIPHAKFIAVDDAAHAVFVDQPEKFDSAVAGFLNSLPGWGHAK